jgi:hypothetical protein
VTFTPEFADAKNFPGGAGNGLDQVEREDEEVAQRGGRSRFHERGRCSPGKERGVRHFHRLPCEFLADRAPRTKNSSPTAKRPGPS